MQSLVYLLSTQEVLIEHGDKFSNWGLFSECFRWIGWWIAKGLAALSDWCEGLLDVAYSLLGFMNYGKVGDFFDIIQPIVFALFALSLCYLGFVKMFNPETKSNLLKNIAIFVFIATSLSYLMTTSNTLVKQMKQLVTGSETTSQSYMLLKNSTTDLLHLDKYDFKLNKGINAISDDDAEFIKYIDISEVVKPKQATNSEVFSKKLTQSEGKLALEDIESDAWIKILQDPYYYRYSVDFLSVYIMLAAMILVYVLSAYKVIRIVYELTMQKIVAPFVSAGDMAGGQKIKQLLQGIVSGYVTLVVVVLLQKLFFLSNTYLSAKVNNPLYRSFFMLCIAFVVIDGPNFFEQLFGIDAGISSGFKLLATMYRAGALAGKVAGKIGKGAKQGYSMGKEKIDKATEKGQGKENLSSTDKVNGFSLNDLKSKNDSSGIDGNKKGLDTNEQTDKNNNLDGSNKPVDSLNEGSNGLDKSQNIDTSDEDFGRKDNLDNRDKGQGSKNALEKGSSSKENRTSVTSGKNSLKIQNDTANNVNSNNLSRSNTNIAADSKDKINSVGTENQPTREQLSIEPNSKSESNKGIEPNAFHGKVDASKSNEQQRGGSKKNNSLSDNGKSSLARNDKGFDRAPLRNVERSPLDRFEKSPLDASNTNKMNGLQGAKINEKSSLSQSTSKAAISIDKKNSTVSNATNIEENSNLIMKNKAKKRIDREDI